MAGVTKHIYLRQIQDIKSMWKNQIKTVKPLLPCEYNEKDIISLIKEFYPHEWKYVQDLSEYYEIKDRSIKKHHSKCRYNMPTPDELIKDVGIYKNLLSYDSKRRHKETFSVELQETERKKLSKKRKPKIEKINNKIIKAERKTQKMTPAYIDKIIGLYSRKNTSQKDRCYLLLELKKYYNKVVIRFFFKLNDTELNRQLRTEAFEYLQSLGYRPRLRKQKYMQCHAGNTKRKEYLKKIYAKQTYSISGTPEELEYRIYNSKEQVLKEYDYFISHSSKDHDAVQTLIEAENRLHKDVFCDWINDSDYLKRHLLCEATLNVIETRLKQSKALIYVKSENAEKSIWCEYELNYFAALGRPIFIIGKDCILNKKFDLELLPSDNIESLVCREDLLEIIK